LIRLHHNKDFRPHPAPSLVQKHQFMSEPNTYSTHFHDLLLESIAFQNPFKQLHVFPTQVVAMCQIQTTRNFAQCKHTRTRTKACDIPNCDIQSTCCTKKSEPGLCVRCTKKLMNPRALNLPQSFDEIDFKDLVKLSLVVLLLAVIGVQVWWFLKQRYVEKKYEPVIEILDELAKALGTNASFRNGRWVQWV